MEGILARIMQEKRWCSSEGSSVMVAGSDLVLVSRRLGNSVCVNSAVNVHLFGIKKDKAAKGKGNVFKF